MARAFLLSLFFIAAPLFCQETLRGEVRVDIEPLYDGFADQRTPPDLQGLRRRALDEGVLFFSAMIYGWSFYYDIGERARGIVEEFELKPQGTIPFGDPRLSVSRAAVEDMRFHVWMDYRPDEMQKRRLGMWKAGAVRSLRSVGFCPLGQEEEGDPWAGPRRKALEDAARAAVRAMLRGSERNRPKSASGFICLAEFPRCFMDSGRVAVSALFRVDLQEIIPFAVY